MQEVYKIFATAPESHTKELIKAMGDAGAGKVGLYTHCAFVTKGFGNYMPNNGANPYSGKVGELNTESEDKVEMVCEKDKLG